MTCLSVFDHFVILALKGLITICFTKLFQMLSFAASQNRDYILFYFI